MYNFQINKEIGKVFHGPARGDGLPQWVRWNGEQYNTPSFDDLESFVMDRCETLDGDYIEADGWAYDGCPSWLLALNLV
tara:strand:- start:4339 stop:4575 length:237 start_codon:yes stop_codon:yes gene_type:complete